MTTAQDQKPKTEKKDPKAPVEDELSEEDKQLKEELDLMVERLSDSDQKLHKPALEALRTSIRTATSSMTSVPKPLKFLKDHYPGLVTIYNNWADGDNKRFLADILSVLSMTYGQEGKRDTLQYRFLGSAEPIGSWGHEYVRHLSAELSSEYNDRLENEKPTEDLVTMALEIVPFFLKHNAEPDACDLLIELEIINKISDFVDKDTYSRVCNYIIGCAPFATPPDDIEILKAAHSVYRKVGQFPEALRTSIRLRDLEMMKDDIESCSDAVLKKQLAFMLAKSQIPYETEDEELMEILANTKLSEHFLSLGRDLEILEAKTPDDIYKRHLENTRSTVGVKVDSARQNLASSFVNAFVNAGFQTDKLLTATSEDNTNWIYKNKDYGMMSATASLGLIHLWDVDNGVSQIDKYTYSEEEYIKAGALMAMGIVSSNVKNESDPALAILSEYVNGDKSLLRSASLFGLGIAYAGSNREDVLELLLPLISDTGLTMELSSLAALSAGLVACGSCHGEVCSTILQTLMEREEKDLKDSFAKFMGLGLALLFVGRQDACDATLETLKAIENPISKTIRVLVEICAYSGTGNVLKIQEMLHLCNDHLDAEKEDDKYQAFAVLGVAMIAMGEDIGSEMALRTFNHLMYYGELVIRRAVPLALGILCASNPLVNILDLLSKLSHDNDQEVAMNSIFAMGLVGAGTNNARLAQMLRHLASYYYKDPNVLFLVRISQGLVHMGKGTMTVNPFYWNRSIMNPVAVAGLLSTLTAFTDVKNTILGNMHYMLYYLVPAMYPRFIITLDENLKPLPVTVRVGQAVDTVGQAGRPKTITGFQTHTTPVLMGYGERAELGTEEYLSLNNVLEGFVILKKNPDYMEEDVGK